MTTFSPSIDHGWAWIIVAGNSINAFFMGGVARSFGVFFQPLIETFDSSATVVSTIITTRMVTAMISVLVAPVLSEEFSERKVVMAGGVIACCSYIVVYFANNISYCILYAILSGIGQGFTLVPSHAILGKYFNKRRALAASISSAGGSIGQLVLPPFCVWLMQEFTLRGAFLILGAMSLHIVAAGALQRPIDLTAIKIDKSTKCVENGSDAALKEKTDNLINTVDSDDSMHVNNTGDENGDVKLTSITESSALTDELHIERTIPQQDTNIGRHGHDHNVTHRSFCTRLRTVISTRLDVKLFAIPSFLVFIILVGGAFGFYRPTKLFIVPSAKEDGIPDQQASLLLTVGAITDICSRLLLGYVTDLRVIQPYQVLATCGVVAGIFICSFPLAHQYWSMMLVIGLIGLTSEVRMYLQMPITVDLVGVSRMPLALGWILFTSMLSQAVLVPLFGYIRDISGSYDLTFYLCGSFVIILSAGIFTIVFLEKRTRTTTAMTTTKRKAIDNNIIHAASVESLAM